MGDQFEDRLDRLRLNERQIAGEVEAAATQQMELVTALIASDEKSRPQVEKRLAVLNQRLISLRKQMMSLSKIICDLELKKVTLSRDLIDIASVQDVMVKLSMHFSQYVRHLCDCDSPSETERQVRDCYRTITNAIAVELNEMVKDLLAELRSPTKEYDPKRKDS